MAKRKRQKNRQHNGQKTEEQTTQWPKEKDRRTDNTMTKRKRQENRQHNGQKKKDQRTNNDLQNIILKTEDRVTRTLLKTGGKLI